VGEKGCIAKMLTTYAICANIALRHISCGGIKEELTTEEELLRLGDQEPERYIFMKCHMDKSY